ncbi:unnamed protein product [Dibothriocephalus latus]|uniref:Phosphatidylinositol-3-phosphatase SAC1 n=1 Tax=Dibothriocephalus latus TaxID=60516 RepID=A0A3P7Q0L9_DIBLA|nr:unnamed protein product [Dibothriocephalus latus]
MVADKTYEFYSLADQYMIYLRQKGEYQRPIVIDRITQEVRVLDFDKPHYQGKTPEHSIIYGILGTIRLLSGRYLITVDERELVGKVFGHRVYRALKFSLHPFAASTSNLKEEEAEKRFVWNGFILDDWSGLLSAALNETPGVAWPKLESHVTPVILGFVGISQPATPAAFLDTPEDAPCYALISRRPIFCTGTRFYTRETDKDATAIETEQLAYIPPGHIFSFLQEFSYRPPHGPLTPKW